MYKKSINKSKKGFNVKTMQVGLVKKYRNKMTNIRQNLLHFDHYHTLSVWPK